MERCIKCLDVKNRGKFNIGKHILVGSAEYHTNKENIKNGNGVWRNACDHCIQKCLFAEGCIALINPKNNNNLSHREIVSETKKTITSLFNQFNENFSEPNCTIS